MNNRKEINLSSEREMIVELNRVLKFVLRGLDSILSNTNPQRLSDKDRLHIEETRENLFFSFRELRSMPGVTSGIIQSEEYFHLSQVMWACLFAAPFLVRTPE